MIASEMPVNANQEDALSLSETAFLSKKKLKESTITIQDDGQESIGVSQSERVIVM